MQAASGLGRVESFSAPGNSTALAKVGNDTATGKAVALDQQSHFIGNSQSERSVPAMPEALTHPKGPTVQEIWPGLYQQLVESSGEKGEPSKNVLQGDAQGRHHGETSSEQRERKENKGTEHRISYEMQIKIVHNAMDEVKANPGDPKVRKNARKLLEEMKEQLSSVPPSKTRASRQLERLFGRLRLQI